MHADPKTMVKHLGPIGAAREWITANQIASVSHLDAAAFNKRLQMFQKCGFEGPLNWYKALNANISFEHERDMEKALDVPVLVVGCGKDQMTLASFQDQLSRPHAKGYYRFEVQDTGHWVMLEAPEATNALLENFFSVVQKSA